MGYRNGDAAASKVQDDHQVSQRDASRVFCGVSAWHEEKCAEGLRQLEFIASAGYEAYFSDSAYNMRQLLALVLIRRATLSFLPFITSIGWTQSSAMWNT